MTVASEDKKLIHPKTIKPFDLVIWLPLFLLLIVSGIFFRPAVVMGSFALIGILLVSFINVRSGLVILLFVGAFSNIISILVSAGDFGGRELGLGALLRDLVLFAVLAGWFSQKIIMNRNICLHARYPILYIFIIFGFVFIAPNHITALLEFRNAAFYIIIMYIASDVFQTKKQIITALLALSFLGILLAIFGILQPLTNASILERIGFKEEMTGFGQHIVCHYPYPWSKFARATAAIDNPIVFGTYMVMHVFILNATRHLVSMEVLKKILYFGMYFVAAAIVLSLSRTAWYSCLASLIVMGFLVKRGRLILLSMAIIISIFALSQISLNKSMTNRFFSKSKIEQGSDKGRIQDIKIGLNALKGNYLLGLGLGTQGSSKTRFSGTNNKSSIPSMATDNYYLQMICEMGIVGLTAYLFLMAYLLNIAHKVYRRSHDLQLKRLAGAFFLVIIACCFANVSSSVFSSRIFVNYFWFAIGLLFAIRKIERTSRNHV